MTFLTLITALYVSICKIMIIYIRNRENVPMLLNETNIVRYCAIMCVYKTCRYAI